MKRTSKISALLLMAVLFATLLPMAVFAEGVVYEWADATQLPTATGSYKLTVDVQVTKTQQINNGKSVVLDLNGHTVTFVGSKYYQVQAGGSLVIEDSVGTGLMVNDGTTSSTYVLYVNGGSLEIRGGTIQNKCPSGYAIYVNAGANAVLNGGTVQNMHATSGRAIYVNGNTSVFTMNGGTLSGTIGVYHPQDGTLNIGGSAVITATSTGVEVRAGEFNLSGGTITTTATETTVGANGSGNTVSGAAVAVSPHSTGHPLSFTMTGGTLNAENGAAGIVESNAQGSATVPTLSMSAGSVNSATPVLTETAAGDDFITGGSFSDKPRGDSIKDNEELGGYAAAVADAGGYKVLPASGIKAGTSSEYFESVEGALATNPDGLIINGDALEDGDTFDIPAGVDAGITYPNSNPGAVEPLPAGGYEVSVPEGSTKPVVTPVSSGVPGEPEPTPGRPNPSTGVKLGGACR